MKKENEHNAWCAQIIGLKREFPIRTDCDCEQSYKDKTK